MGSSFMRLGGAAVETVGSQLFKRLGKEADHIGKVIAKQAPEVTETLIKEVDNYPPAGEYIKGLYRNGELDELQEYVTDLRRGASNKQVSNNVQEIVNKSNKPEVAAKAAAVEVPEAPVLKREITGLEGKEFKDAKKGLRQEFATWLDSEPNLLDDVISKKRARSEFAPEGIYIDGEEHRFTGVSAYKRTGQLPGLKASKQSVADANRNINSAIQTLGPKMKPKPEVLDIFNEVVPPGDVHKHHILILKVMEPFFMTLNAAGQRVPRSKEQRIAIMKAIQAQGWFTGDVDANMIWQSAKAHQRGKKSSHAILRMFSDIQGRGVGEVFEEGYGPTKLSGTYDPKAVHGFSEEHLDKLANLKDAKSVTNALLMFLDESGAGEFMKGAAHIGSKTHDAVGPGTAEHMENLASAGQTVEKAIGKLKKPKKK